MRNGVAGKRNTRLAFRLSKHLFVLICVSQLHACGKSAENVDSAHDSESIDTLSSSATLAQDLPAAAATSSSGPDKGHPDNVLSQIVVDSPVNPGVNAQWTSARFATAGLIEPATQRPGDSVKGRKALLEEAYVSCGLPERVFRELLTDTDVVEVSGRTDKASGLPFNVNVTDNADGLSIVSNNCLTCHGTSLFGELVLGLGNEFLDFTGNASNLVERAGVLVRGDTETRAWELYADRINAVAPYIQTRTVGVNPANNLTFALIAHRHADTNEWSDEPLLALPPADPPPVSVPPWWRMKKKPAMFNLGEGRLDHARIMMSASMLCTDSIEELQSIDEYAGDIRAFIADLEPPAWPFDIDDALANTGKQVFEKTCTQCHGNYDKDEQYPARIVPIDLIQTDALLVDFAHQQGVPYIDWFNRSFYGQTATMAPGAGYVAPPLDGVWATAPFLHNGSVPSLRALLDSKTRPGIWYHTVTDSSDPDSYDTVNLGWPYQQLQDPESASRSDPSIGMRLYDTRTNGYSNAGHRFGDHLSESERSAVLEYLKTI